MDNRIIDSDPARSEKSKEWGYRIKLHGCIEFLGLTVYVSYIR